MRALLIVLDSVGIGYAPDAAAFGDQGANTLGHIYDRVPHLALPNLDSLGLSHALRRETAPAGLRDGVAFGWMSEASSGKDTTIGHWEIAGVEIDQPFSTFERFPDELIEAIEAEAGVEFIGNYPQSGTTILEELGEEHVACGKPILYTSADSVLQIAAHEEVIPLPELYRICTIARQHSDARRIGRVIARPFVGTPDAFERTTNRRDFSMRPPETVLDAIPVTGVGKISDIFAGRGIDESHPTKSNAAGMKAISSLWDTDFEGLLFANLVDFDMLYGHRRDPEGYATCLAEFDAWLGDFLPHVAPEDFLLITADHGNDPTWSGTDHTREQVPLLTLHGEDAAACCGEHPSFAGVADLIANFFKVNPDR